VKSKGSCNSCVGAASVVMDPLPKECYDSTLLAKPEQVESWRSAGLAAIKAGKVSYLDFDDS
jgi:hypothetical protein